MKQEYLRYTRDQLGPRTQHGINFSVAVINSCMEDVTLSCVGTVIVIQVLTRFIFSSNAIDASMFTLFIFFQTLLCVVGFYAICTSCMTQARFCRMAMSVTVVTSYNWYTYGHFAHDENHQKFSMQVLGVPITSANLYILFGQRQDTFQTDLVCIF